MTNKFQPQKRSDHGLHIRGYGQAHQQREVLVGKVGKVEYVLGPLACQARVPHTMPQC